MNTRGAINDDIGVGCGRHTEPEKLGPLTMAGINRNKECNEVSVMMRFKVDSGGQAVNNGYRK